MYLSDIIRRSGRSLRSAKVRTILTAMAIAVGGFTLTLTLAASNGAREYSERLIQSNFDPSELVVAKDKTIFGNEQQSGPKEYDESQLQLGGPLGGGTSLERLDESDLEVLAQTEGVEAVRPSYSLTPQFITRAEGEKRYNAGMEVYGDGQVPDIIAGFVEDAPDDGTLVLAEEFLSALGFSSPEEAVGQTIEVQFRKPFQLDASALQPVPPPAPSAPDQPPAPPPPNPAAQLEALQKPLRETFTVAAVSRLPATALSFSETPPLLINENDAKKLHDFVTKDTSEAGKFLVATVKVRDGQNQANVTTVQEALKAKGYNVQSVEDTQEFLDSIINTLQYIVTGFGVITLIASVFGIVNTQYISVLERTREIGLMKALGMRGSNVSRLFMFEASWIGFLGGIIGAGLGVLATLVLNPPINRALNLGEGNYLLVNVWWQIALLVLALILIAMAAGLLPARKAAKLDPIEALRTE